MIDFIRYTTLYVLISLIVIGSGMYSVFTHGLDYSIDFTGGSNIRYSLEKNVDKKDVEKIYADNGIEVLDYVQDGQVIALKTTPVDEVKETVIRTKLSEKAGNVDVQLFETVGPSLGAETVKKTAIASIVAIIGILLYITYTFRKWTYGLAAIGALFHDFLVLIGVYSMLGQYGAEIDALFITAVLTTMSFSVHDTIVVFDKIREYRRTSGLDIEILANKALTETMVRSVNNSLTIILMLVPLTFAGGVTIQFFAGALLIGTITGTYSSPFVATPLLVFLQKRAN